MKTQLYVLLILIMTLASCKPVHNLERQNETRDSIVFVQEYIRDTLVYVQTKTITDVVDHYIELDCDSTDFQQQFNTGKTSLKLSKTSGKVRIQFNQDSIQSVETAQSQSQHKSNLQQSQTRQTQTTQEVIIKNQIPKWYWWLLIGSNVFWVLFRNTTLKFLKII